MFVGAGAWAAVFSRERECIQSGATALTPGRRHPRYPSLSDFEKRLYLISSQYLHPLNPRPSLSCVYILSYRTVCLHIIGKLETMHYWYVPTFLMRTLPIICKRTCWHSLCWTCIQCLQCLVFYLSVYVSVRQSVFIGTWCRYVLGMHI